MTKHLHSYTFITLQRYFLILGLLFFTNFSNNGGVITFSGYGNAHAEGVIEGYPWVIKENGDGDLLNSKSHDIFTFGDVFYEKDDDVILIDDKISCLIFPNISNENINLNISFIEKSNILSNNAVNGDVCLIDKRKTDPIIDNRKLSVLLKDDKKLFFNFRQKSRLIYFEHKSSSASALLAFVNNNDDFITFRFPVDSQSGIKSILVVFSTKNFKHILSELKKHDFQVIK